MTTLVIAATTSAISDKSARFHANGSGDVSMTAIGLADAETITPYIGGGAEWQEVYDGAGEQVVLTATKPQLTLPAGFLYAFDKSVTAGAVSLIVTRSYEDE